MKATDKTVLLALPVVALLAAFWFLVLAPKREEASRLVDETERLEASVAQQEALAETAELARKSFPEDYHRVVVLGKAVPEGADTPSLLVQLDRLGGSSGVVLNSVKLNSEGTAAEPPPAPAAPPATPAGAAEQSEQQVAAAEAGTPAPAAPTEAAAATLPIGATVGPAGLPVMPYTLELSGDFFGIADFIGEVDRMVGLRKSGQPSVFGRLVTIDGFTLTVPDLGSGLEASFAVTTYLTPADEGPTGGATPSGPALAQPQTISTGSTTPAPPAASVGASLTAGGGQ